MPTTIKKCNLCHAELTVSDEAQVVECPKCRSVNGYGYSHSNQNDNYVKGPRSDKNTGVMPNSQYHQQPPFSPASSQEQALMHALLGGTTQPGTLHFVDTNSLFQQSPQASSQHSPRLAKTNSFFQHPPQVSPSSQASIRMLKTNYSSFQQLSQISSSLQSSLSPVKTKTTFQLPSQTSSPPIPEKMTNNFFQQGSPRPSYTTTPRPLHTSSLPTPEKTNNFYEKPQETSSPQGSPRPTYINSFNQQPSRTVSPLISAKTNNFSQLPQQTSSPRWSPRPAYGNTSYQQPLQSSPTLIQEKTENFSQLPQQTSSPQGLHRSSFSNTCYQKPLPSSPLESPDQPQTTPPQGSSPRPSRFSSFLRPQAAQTPPPQQGSPPLAHSDDNNQKPSQPSSQISFTIEADTDDDDNYTKRRLKEFREQLQI